MQSEALLAGEEVCSKLQADSVERAVGIRGQRRATQLSQQDPSILGAVPDPKHIVNLLRVENQEMQTVKQRGKILNLIIIIIIIIIIIVIINDNAIGRSSYLFKM